MATPLDDLADIAQEEFRSARAEARHGPVSPEPQPSSTAVEGELKTFAMVLDDHVVAEFDRIVGRRQRSNVVRQFMRDFVAGHYRTT